MRKRLCAVAAAMSLAALLVAGCGGPAAEPWSMDSDCGSCHVVELGTMEDEACMAADHAAYDCASCHSDESALAVAHEGATAEGVGQATSSAAEEMADCRSCHDRKELVAETEEALVKADGKSTANPHSNHVSVDSECVDCHTAHNASVLTCNECHDFALPDGWVAGEAE